MLRNPNYIYGDCEQDVPLKLNLGEHILETCLKYGNRIAYINAETEETINYSEIAQYAMNLAVSLTELGVRKGEVIAVCTESRKEFWPTFIGSICAGAVFTPISFLYSAEELTHTLNISKPSYIFCSPLAYKVHRSSITSQKYIKKVMLYGDRKVSTELLYNDLISRTVNREQFVTADVVGQTDTVVILYSSGTTGMPKGVIMTHYNAIVYCTLVKSPESKTYVSLAPWYHTFGFWKNISGMIDGDTIVNLSKFNEKLYLQCIQKYKPTYLYVVPAVVIILSKSEILKQYDVSSVKFFYCGAAPLAEDTIHIIHKRFPNLKAFLQGYGMTESLTICKYTEEIYRPDKITSVGCVMPATTIKVVDLKTGQALGPNQRGEICVKGSLQMKGYVGMERGEDYDAEGFFRTGDIGYYDDDKYFYIVDRLKELIKYKGYQVPPAQIEAALIEHPRVRDAGVVGVRDSVAGEVPRAFVVTQPGPGPAPTEGDLQRYIADRLSNPKHLRGGVIFVKEIPRNPSGKILRKKLREILLNTKSKI